ARADPVRAAGHFRAQLPGPAAAARPAAGGAYPLPCFDATAGGGPLMFKPFANSARALSSGPVTGTTCTGLIVIPVLVMGLLTWAFWAPDSDHGTATAAVVNNDKPVEVNGQMVPLGRELAGSLTHNEDSAFRWVLTDDEDAEEGLKSGKYAAVVTIPE